MKHKKSKTKELPERGLNVWNKYDFAMCGLGEKNRFIAKLKHIKRCIKYSRQRIVRGYSDSDVWDMYGYFQLLFPEMLQHLKDNRHGSPGFLGENYTNEEGILVNDTCHAEWDEILDKMIFLWRESNEATCSKKNPYYEEHDKALSEFTDKYGLFGEKLQTEEEMKRNDQGEIYCTMHFMDELPEYKEISEKYRNEEKKLEEYRNSCKDEALEMLKEYFLCLWD